MAITIKKALPLALLLAAGTVSAESHLDKVQKAGVLRVCATGDYKPYTFQNKDGSYEGIDITMMESLAKSLGVKPQWVKTTWKTILPDLVAGKCDIAVGGVSVTVVRQKQAYFADRLAIDGKIPLVRCEDKDKYQTVEQINHPNVRVIEPIGGTNEIFARTYLTKVKLIMSDDNMGIFQQIVDKKADVMITDSSEALYQQKRKPSLCAINPNEPLQYSEKAYMLPRDDISWKLYVDQWLHLSKANGEYQKVVAEWLAQPE